MLDLIYYLFDTSALLSRYLPQGPQKKILDAMYIQRIKGEAFFYFPIFCVAEVFNTFARLRYREKKINEKEHRCFTASFKGDIRNRKVLYCYTMSRYHNYNADEIYEVEHTLEPLIPNHENPKGKCSLSAFDILIIAMAMELRRIHPKDKMFIVTNDERLSRVANYDNEKFAPALYLREMRPEDIPN